MRGAVCGFGRLARRSAGGSLEDGHDGNFWRPAGGPVPSGRVVQVGAGRTVGGAAQLLHSGGQRLAVKRPSRDGRAAGGTENEIAGGVRHDGVDQAGLVGADQQRRLRAIGTAGNSPLTLMCTGASKAEAAGPASSIPEIRRAGRTPTAAPAFRRPDRFGAGCISRRRARRHRASRWRGLSPRG